MPERGKDPPGLRSRYGAWLTALLLGAVAMAFVIAPLPAQTPAPARGAPPAVTGGVPSGAPPMAESGPQRPVKIGPPVPLPPPPTARGPAPPAAATPAAGSPGTPSVDAEDLLDLGLRIVWGSGQSRQWNGTIRIDRGQFSDFRLLGLEADEPGSMDCTEREVRIQQPSPRAYDGLDLRVVAPRSARLFIELAPSGGGDEQQRRRVERPLSDFIDDFHKEPLDDQENRLLIRRSPGDQLRVTFARDSLVFAPGEQFVFEVQPHELGVVSSASRCRLSLVARDTGQEVWSAQRDLRPTRGGFERIGPLAVDMPAEEAVYDLVVSLTQRRLATPFVRPRSLLERRVQTIVIGHERPQPPAVPWKQVAEIDPASGNWWERMTRISQLLPGFSQGQLNNGKVRRSQVDGQPMVELTVDGWQAYPLPIDRVGQPHLVVVEYPRSRPQALGISLVEPDATGKVLPIGLDSGVAVEDSADESATLHTHRLIFWPRTKAPLLLLTNRHPQRPAVFGRIQVLAGPSSLPVAELPLDAVDGTAASAARPLRQVAAYFDKPLFPENFSAGESLDENSGQSLDDWNTFYRGGRRLAEYLRHVGYPMAIVSVACEGGTLYPSRVLQPTPKYDTGAFFVSGQDPVPKDAVEMLFRLFDREGLKLVPAVHFACRLPELESLRRGPPEAVLGLDLIDEDGRTWAQRFGTRGGQAPYYNPLDPRVQSALRRVVDELVARYGHHESFAGIALQMGPETYAQLPGPLWGIDDRTIGRFEQESNVEVPGHGPARFSQRAAFLGSTAQPLWLRWRSQQLARLHLQLLQDMQRRRPGSRLILATGDLLGNVPPQSQLLPSLTSKSDVNGMLLGFGLDATQYQDNPRLALLRPQRIAPILSLGEQAVNLEVDHAVQLDETFGRLALPGSLLFHEAQTLRLPSFDEKSPFGAENTYSWLVTHFAPAADQARRRFVHSVAQLDAQLIVDGGWMLPLGQEAELTSVLATFRQLPAARFETLATAPGTASDRSLIVRRLSQDGRTYLYLVNDAPWAVTAELSLETPPGSDPQLLVPLPSARFERQGGGGRWTVPLQPYDLAAAVFASPDVKVTQWQTNPPEAVATRLRGQITELRDRIKAVTGPRPMAPLANAGFELDAPGEPLTGWVHATGTGIEVGADGSQRLGGQRSLKISRRQSQGPDAWVRSEPFPVPETGRLRVSIWLRTDDEQRQPPLRLAIEGRLAGQTYYRFANVGADNPNARLRTRWAEYQFVVDNLPLSGLTDLRVGFDLMGPGEVWVDDVRMFDLWFDKTERDELLKSIALADLHLDEGKLAACQRFLDSYWSRFLQYHLPPTESAVAALPRSDARPRSPVLPRPDDQPRPENQPSAPNAPAPAPTGNAEPAGSPPPASLLERVRQLVPKSVLPF